MSPLKEILRRSKVEEILLITKELGTFGLKYITEGEREN